MSKTVVIGIPVYKKEISYLEKISLFQVHKVLSCYKKVFIAPESLCFDYGVDYDTVRFSDKYFSSTESYSDLLMSVEFYEAFIRYEFLLIYQLDAFVFYDALNEFCSMEYDYIGAPLRGRDWQLFHVGNGGLSLRNVRSCRRVVEQKDDIIAKLYDDMTPTVLAEDVFFGYCGWKKDVKFSVPSARIAARFSVQSDYARGMRHIEKKGLPFGCHYWWKENYNFWKLYIEKYGYKLEEMQTSETFKYNQIKRLMYFSRRRIRGGEPKEIGKIKGCLPGKGVYSIYGGGFWGEKCLEFLQLLPIEIRVIFDRDIDNKIMKGVPVIKPDYSELVKKDSYVVITSMKYETEIKERLLKAGLKEGMDFCSMYDLFIEINKPTVAR